MRPIYTIICIALIVWPVSIPAAPKGEDITGEPWATGPEPFSIETRVKDSDWAHTTLEIIITPRTEMTMPTAFRKGVGLVAVSPTGSIGISIDEVDATPLTKLGDGRSMPHPQSFSKMIHVDRPGIWRDLRVVPLSVQPCISAGTDDLLARKIVVTIRSDAGMGINEKSHPVSTVSPVWDSLYRKHVLNYEHLNLSVRNRGTGNRYLVISRAQFDTLVPDFVEWKTRQGYGVEVKTIESLGYSGSQITTSGCIDATKDYIETAYNTWPDGLDFVLLVGDIFDDNHGGSIWSEKFYNYFYGQGYKFHDQWYSYLEGDDLFPDIFVGRLPDSNTDRMSYLISKTIGYEKNPYIDGTWQKNALMTLKSYHWDSDVNNHIIAAKNFVSDILSDWGMNVTEKFQSQANSSQILPVINQGLTFYNYRGDYCSSTDWNNTFDDGDVQYVSNINKLGIWTVLSCSSANFDYSYTSTAEALLRHGYTDPTNPKGAIAFIGAQAYTSYLFNDPLDKGIYLAWANSAATLLGQAFTSGRIYAWNNATGLTQNKKESGMKEYTILGDPSLQVWTDVPTSISVSADPATVPTGTQTNVELTVSTTSRAPVPDALVCLWKGTEVYTYGYTNGSGAVTLSVTPSTAGNITLTVTGYNRIPFLGTIATTASSIPRAPEGLTASVTGGTNVVLTWNPVTQDLSGSPISIDHYEVFRSTDAYFETGALSPIGTPSGTSYMDTGSAGNDNANYFYRIIAVSAGAENSEPSDPAGEFDYDLD